MDAPGQNFFIFMQFSGKISQIGWRSLQGLVSPGKPWIRHCLTLQSSLNLSDNRQVDLSFLQIDIFYASEKYEIQPVNKLSCTALRHKGVCQTQWPALKMIHQKFLNVLSVTMSSMKQATMCPGFYHVVTHCARNASDN